LPRFLADKDPTVVSWAVNRAKISDKNRIPLFAKITSSGPGAFLSAMELLPLILNEPDGVLKWRHLVETGRPYVAVAAFASMGFEDRGQTDTADLLVSILPILERVDEPFSAVLDLDRHWPQFRDLEGQMMTSRNRFVRAAAAEAACSSTRVAALYLNDVL